MWKLNKSKVLIEDTPDEEAQPDPQSKDQLLQADLHFPVSQLATKVQGASFRGWKDMTSIFNKDDEQQLLKGSKSPKSKVASVKTKDEVKTEKKSGFWDTLAIKQNIQPKKADEIEGWEPPQIMVEDPLSFAEDPLDDNHSWQGWEEESKGSSKYTNLASSGNTSRASLKTKDEVKTEKKSGFWDTLAIKQNIQPKKADEIEGWEPPQIMVEDSLSFAEDPLDDNHSWQGREEEESKGSSKYTNLASSGNASRWCIKSAGKLVSIRRRSKGNLTENWEELE